jgi:hypothetical protein
LDRADVELWVLQRGKAALDLLELLVVAHHVESPELCPGHARAQGVDVVERGVLGDLL